MATFITIFKNSLKSDRNSQRELYETYYGYALKIAFRYIPGYDDARMVVNDAFVKAFKNLHRFEELTAEESLLEFRFMGWLKRIVVHTAIDVLRKSNREIPEVPFDSELAEQHFAPDQADAGLMYKELICYLKELPPAYNKVFNLYVIDGYSHAEIADMLQISVGTSKSNLFRAKELLQKKVADFFETKKL
ncbi:MAG: RNA polymerase sigma factor [Sediminibacterium sp.]|nr:RNA polymerase sigma factor [Sediminibacterium sp.]